MHIKALLTVVACALPAVAAGAYPQSLAEGAWRDWGAARGVYGRIYEDIKTGPAAVADDVAAELTRGWLTMAEGSIPLTRRGIGECATVLEEIADDTTELALIERQLAQLCAYMTLPDRAAPTTCASISPRFWPELNAFARREIVRNLTAERRCLIGESALFLTPTHTELTRLAAGALGLVATEGNRATTAKADAQLGLATAVRAEAAALAEVFLAERGAKRSSLASLFYSGLGPYDLHETVAGLANDLVGDAFVLAPAAYKTDVNKVATRDSVYVDQPEPWHTTPANPDAVTVATPEARADASLRSALHCAWAVNTELKSTGLVATCFPKEPFESPLLNGIFNPNDCATGPYPRVPTTTTDETAWQRFAAWPVTKAFAPLEQLVLDRHNCVATLTGGDQRVTLNGQKSRADVLSQLSLCALSDRPKALTAATNAVAAEPIRQAKETDAAAFKSLIWGLSADVGRTVAQLGWTGTTDTAGADSCLAHLNQNTPVFP